MKPHHTLSAICDKVIFAIAILLIPGLSKSFEEPPLKIPFNVVEANKTIRLNIKIPKRNFYTFGLTFEVPNRHDDQQIQSLREMMGDSENYHPSAKERQRNFGVPLSIRLRVARLEPLPAMVVFNQEIGEIQRYAGYGGKCEKKIADVDLEGGVYQITISNVRPAPELRNLSVHVHINEAYLGK